MQLLSSEVNAHYYTHPLGIISLLILTITYMQAMTYGRFNNHTAHIFTGLWSQQPLSWM